MYIVAEHYEVRVCGYRYCVCAEKERAENIARAIGGCVRVIPAHVIGKNL